MTPEGWTESTLRRLGISRSGSGFPPALQGRTNEEIAFYKVNHLAKANRRGVLQGPDDTVSRDTAAQLRAEIFPPGSIVYAKVGAALLLGRIRTLGRPSCIDNNMSAFVSNGSIDSRYLYYLMSTIQFARLVNPGAVPSLSDKNVMDTKVLVPNTELQRKLADYLDRETQRIDELIAEQHGLIEALEERRYAELSSVLVEGIVVPLKYVVHDSRPMTYGILQPGPILDEGVSYVSPHDLKGDRTASLASLRRTTSAIETSYARSRIRGGEVLVSLGPGYGKIGVAPPEYNGVNIARDVARISCDPNRVLAEYVRLSLLTVESKSYWRREIIGATFGRLNLNVLSRTPIHVPDLNRQAALVEQLDARLGQIDTLITESEDLIALSQERRAALIIAAVTGQIDVRTAA